VFTPLRDSVLLRDANGQNPPRQIAHEHSDVHGEMTGNCLRELSISDFLQNKRRTAARQPIAFEIQRLTLPGFNDRAN